MVPLVVQTDRQGTAEFPLIHNHHRFAASHQPWVDVYGDQAMILLSLDLLINCLDPLIGVELLNDIF